MCDLSKQQPKDEADGQVEKDFRNKLIVLALRRTHRGERRLPKVANVERGGEETKGKSADAERHVEAVAEANVRECVLLQNEATQLVF